jgi:hypothetical protein
MVRWVPSRPDSRSRLAFQELVPPKAASIPSRPKVVTVTNLGNYSWATTTPSTSSFYEQWSRLRERQKLRFPRERCKIEDESCSMAGEDLKMAGRLEPNPAPAEQPAQPFEQTARSALESHFGRTLADREWIAMRAQLLEFGTILLSWDRPVRTNGF